ncbi:MAG: DUF2333 family protein [Alcanivoracaceae bacterium]|nr:DUF2333 family protein [Alcanivoracaceae bacterium]
MTDNRYPVNKAAKKKSKLQMIKWLIILFIIINGILMLYYDREPKLFDVKKITAKRADLHGHQVVTGLTTTVTLLEVADTLLHKPGGYLSNDKMPPSVFMDNIPNWEYGVLVQIRDLARVLRNDFSRSQSQSLEDDDLKRSDPKFHFDNVSWILPRTESQYEEAIEDMHKYLSRLGDSDHTDAQFYARADNLVTWLNLVEKRLGGLSQKLSASVAKERLNTDLSGDTAATQSTYRPSELKVKTSWFKIDDNFYEARGSTWALIHFLKAMEIDFSSVLEKKNAQISLRQIIRELESTQESIWTPMILNGSGFGFFANHSLVMASYISRANAGIIDLRQLLENG